MPVCPDCNQNNAQSKGNKRTKQGLARRYICNNCGRNFTVNPNKDKDVVDNTESQTNTESLGSVAIKQLFDRNEWQKQYHAENTTITISKDTKQWLDSLKNYEKEPINSVLVRIQKKQVIL